MAAKGQTLKEFEPLHPAEITLLAACRDGRVAIIARSRPKKRTQDNCVRADFIRFLARGGGKDAPVHDRGVRLRGAVVIGVLNLAGVRVPHPLRLLCCQFQDQGRQFANLILRGTILDGGLSLDGSRVQGIDGKGLQARGDIRLGRGFRAAAAVRLHDAHIEGILHCASGSFSASEGSVLSFDRAKISGSVFLNGNFRAKGEVRFLGADIGGSLMCMGAQCVPTEGDALSFDEAKISGSVFFKDNFEATGTVRFYGAEIGGNLECDEAYFQPNKGEALNFEGAKIGGSVFLRTGFHAEGDVVLSSAEVGDWLELSHAAINGEFNVEHAIIQNKFKLTDMQQRLTGANLRHMQCGSLLDDSTSWGTGNHLNGFTYRSLAHEAPIKPEFRVKWLQDQSSDSGAYRPQPWRHLQMTLKAMGHDAEAREIGIAHESERRDRKIIGAIRENAGRTERFYARVARAFHYSYGVFTDYGYRPIKLVAWMVGVWLVCSLIFWCAARGGVMGPASPLILTNVDYRHKCGVDSENAPAQFSIKYKHNNWYYCRDLPSEFSTFNAFIYSLDLILPPVNLFQVQDWSVRIPSLPDERGGVIALDPYIVWLVICFEVLFGWMASLMLVAVISGMARNTRDDE